MTQYINILWSKVLLILLCIVAPARLQAIEILTIEDALNKCKDTYPTQLQAKKRLACFDSISTPAIEVKTEAIPAVPVGGSNADKTATAPTNTATVPANARIPEAAIAIKKTNKDLSYLERKWRLTSEGDWDISDFETYKANYLLVTNSSNVNNTPTSPSRPNIGDRNLDSEDIKFQLSLKSEMLNNIPLIRDLPYVTSSRLWGAYTQQSYWQIFNAEASRPLRENNYEPELILSLGIDNEVDGIKKEYIPRMLNLGVVHQSNGRDNPLSRSWNRVYLEGGFELTDRLSLLVRPWWRIPENKSDDDNPDIEKYMGYGDMTVRWETENRDTAVSLLLRNNLRSDNKGFAQIDLQQRVFNNPYLKLHVLASTGYGETLLDYNRSQNVLGFGISLGE
ncbi:MAG TPA: phospholipase A [Methylotenera sp.]|jgi:phospholipase A1|nr:phospholipase A [Methylotenera sp.]